MYESVKDKPEGKKEVQKELSEAIEVLLENDIDWILCEVTQVNQITLVDDMNPSVFPQY